MKDIIQDVLSKINVNQTLKSVTDKGIEKMAASAVGQHCWTLARFSYC